jgi:hypothetical protein
VRPIYIIFILSALVLINACGGGATEEVTEQTITPSPPPANPSPPTATPSAPVSNKYSVGGSVSGLIAPELTIQSNLADEIIIDADGSFVFPTAFENGSAYQVLIINQPEAQTCSITNANGQIEDEDVTNVTIVCENNPPPQGSYSVSGTVSGLTTSQIVIQSNLADEITIDVDGNFVFPTDFENGSAYQVLIINQPEAQTCSITNANGQIADEDVTNVTIVCENNPPPEGSYSVSGTVSGLTTSQIVIQSNLADEITIDVNGSFVFPTVFENGSTYQVLITDQPEAQTCSITNASGQIADEDVTDVAIVCENNPPPQESYSVSGTVSGLTTSQIVIQSNLADEITIDVDGGFVFPTDFPNGSDYEVTILVQPQTLFWSSPTGHIPKGILILNG